MSSDPGPEDLDPFLRGLLDAFESGMMRREERRRYTSEEKDWAIAAILNGSTLTEAAMQVRAPPSTVQTWCKAAGVPTGRRSTRCS